MPINDQGKILFKRLGKASESMPGSNAFLCLWVIKKKNKGVVKKTRAFGKKVVRIGKQIPPKPNRPGGSSCAQRRGKREEKVVSSSGWGESKKRVCHLISKSVVREIKVAKRELPFAVRPWGSQAVYAKCRARKEKIGRHKRTSRW